jgi:hypothetical protein
VVVIALLILPLALGIIAFGLYHAYGERYKEYKANQESNRLAAIAESKAREAAFAREKAKIAHGRRFHPPRSEWYSSSSDFNFDSFNKAFKDFDKHFEHFDKNFKHFDKRVNRLFGPSDGVRGSDSNVSVSGSGDGSTVTVNGTAYHVPNGKSISVRNGILYVDGKKYN